MSLKVCSRQKWKVFTGKNITVFCKLRFFFLVFEEYLIDGDYAMNAGCWMWVSGSAFMDKISERSTCPVKMGRVWDPTGTYVKKYCPELKNMPLKYIFSPWEAPLAIQEAANVCSKMSSSTFSLLFYNFKNP